MRVEISLSVTGELQKSACRPATSCVGPLPKVTAPNYSEASPGFVPTNFDAHSKHACNRDLLQAFAPALIRFKFLHSWLQGEFPPSRAKNPRQTTNSFTVVNTTSH